MSADGHLADPETLERIAPGIDPAAPSAADIARIAFHERAHGREPAGPGPLDWTGEMPPRDLVREAAPEVMAEPSVEAARGRLPILLRRAHARLAARGADASARRIEILSRRRAHDGFYALDEISLRHETYEGGMTAPLDRAVFVSYDAAVLLPYDPGRDRVCLVEQFRLGPFGRGDPDPWMAEPVAGLIDPGEDAETTAIREAREEAGLDIARAIPLGAGYTSPGASTGFHHHFIGLCEIPEGGGTGGLASEGEDIRIVPMPAGDLFARLDAGRLRNAPLILCALALRAMRETLRAG